MANGNQENPGSVASGIVHRAEPSPEAKWLEVLIGRWINEGNVVQEDGTPESKILVSDVYEWAPGRFFVIHPAYGRIGDVGVGGVEIIGYDTASQKYRSHFFDSQQPPDVSLGGGHRDVQGLRDLGVGQPSGDQGQDFALPVGDAFQGRGGLPAGFRAAGELGDEPPGDGRGELSVAGGDDPDRGEQAGGRGVLQQEPTGPARSAA